VPGSVATAIAVATLVPGTADMGDYDREYDIEI